MRGDGMKKIIFILSAIMTFCLFGTPVLAYSDYGLVYDATELLDADYCQAYGAEVFSDIAYYYSVQARVDVVDDLEGYSIEDYAQIFYDNYEYGYPDTGDCILLMLYVTKDDTGLEFEDYYVFCGGKNEAELSGIRNGMNKKLDRWLSTEKWSGGVESDKEAFNNALSNFSSYTQKYLGGETEAAGADTAAAEEGTGAAEIGTGAAEVGAGAAEVGTGADGAVAEESGTEVAVGAESSETAGSDDTALLYNVTDAAGILEEADVKSLEDKAEKVSKDYQCEMYIVIVEDYLDFGEETPYEAAKSVYKDYNLGYGKEKDGALLLLSMADRDYAFIAFGYGNTAFTDYGREKLEGKFLDNFAEDDWVGGFNDYLDNGAEMLAMAREGTPLDTFTSPAVIYGGTAFSIIVGFLISLAICMVLRKRMKSVGVQGEANNYVKNNSIIFTERKEYLVHEERKLIKHQDNSSGGGSTSIDSEGFSGNSGKF